MVTAETAFRLILEIQGGIAVRRRLFQRCLRMGLAVTTLMAVCGVARAEERVERIKVDLLPGVYHDGEQWLRVRVHNWSGAPVVLEPGLVPTELVIDGTACRSARVDTQRQSPYLIRSGASRGGRALNVDEDWIAVDSGKAVELEPGKHTVQAVVYARVGDDESGQHKTRVVSNAVELDPQGRAPKLCDVRFRMLGGEEKKPLKGLELTVSFAGKDVTETTEEDGGATFHLARGTYKISFTSPRALPYLRFERTDYEYRVNRYRTIHVNDRPAEQTIDVVLPSPCELVLRAVDADTGEGIPGVRFARENLYGEIWAAPIVDDTIMPNSERKDPSKDDKSDVTDEQGYLHRLVGPRHEKWTYYMLNVPKGYARVFERDVKIDTPLGKKRAEHTFLLQKNDRVVSNVQPKRGTLKIETPEGWEVVRPKSTLIQAEFALPKADGDDSDGRLTVMMAGGSIDANVRRWRGQFEELEDKPVEEIDVSGTKVTLVDLRGTYREQRGMVGPVAKRPGYRVLAAIISTSQGLLFVKGYGPANTMARHAATFRKLVESLASTSE